jgi:hypothetical protein
MFFYNAYPNRALFCPNILVHHATKHEIISRLTYPINILLGRITLQQTPNSQNWKEISDYLSILWHLPPRNHKSIPNNTKHYTSNPNISADINSPAHRHSHLCQKDTQFWKIQSLQHAHHLEHYLKTPAKIWFKHEDVSPISSHKLNRTIARIYYDKKWNRTSPTKIWADQWETALSPATTSILN